MGRIVTGAGSDDCYTFLEQSSTLWHKSMGDPRSQSDYDGKLRGDYIWPISIDIPKTVTLPNGSGGACQVFNLPQTFVEPNSRASIEYSFAIRISRSKLRQDNLWVFISSSLPEGPTLMHLQIEDSFCLRTYYQARPTVISPSNRLSGG